MILRFHTSQGIKRINVENDCFFGDLIKKFTNQLCTGSNDVRIFLDHNYEKEVDLLKTAILSSNYENGQLFYLKESNKISVKETLKIIFTDEIDNKLFNSSGFIENPVRTQRCDHNSMNRCIHCASIECFTNDYLKTLEPPLKHIPFHCYLKQQHVVLKDQYLTLESPRCSIDLNCKNHPPFPEASCSNCIPKAISLENQPFRFIDNINFQSHLIVDRFLEFWRKSGAQRIGIMYGFYDEMENIPLGIRLNVCYIYEPPQKNSNSGITLLDDPNNDLADELGNTLGLKKVGIIFTHLIQSQNLPGKVDHLRSKDTYFLTGQELITCASYQNTYKSGCKLSPTGYYGSKFATVVITGNDKNEIEFYGWQISVQGMALVEEDLFLPTINHPGMVYLKESTTERIVPEVIHRESDNNTTITKFGEAIPVEYFLTQITVGFPLTEKPYLKPTNFPICNRERISEIANQKDVKAILESRDSDFIWSSLKNFHILFYLSKFSSSVVNIKQMVIKFCECYKKNDFDMFFEVLNSEDWNSFLAYWLYDLKNNETTEVIEEIDLDTTNEDVSWVCSHCTFINDIKQKNEDGIIECSMCMLPMQ